MFKKGLLALTLVFSLPVFAAEHWIDVRVPEQYQQEHVQGAINIPLKEVKERIATAVPDKNDTVKVYCNAGRQSGQAKDHLPHEQQMQPYQMPVSKISRYLRHFSLMQTS